MCASILSAWEASRSTAQISPFDWLKKQSLYPKVYWKSAKHEFALAGACCTLEHIPTEKGFFFGGRAFSLAPGKDSCWKKIPRLFFFQPQEICFGKEKNSSILTQNTSYQKTYLPDYSLWEKQLLKSLARIESNMIQKIVHARKTSLIFQEELDAFYFLQKMAVRTDNATLFFLQPEPGTTFLGLTPEKLYTRQGQKIVSHALAGTRPIGKVFEEELLASPKEQREFEMVRRYLRDRLSELCDELHCDETHVIQTGALQHLTSNFSGELHSHISDEEIIRSLHPTPAVCGLPLQKTLDLLAEEEPFDRGWYSGCLGWITPTQAEMVVGIRSALIQQNEMHLFSGAGIVRDSHPLHEWDELEQKISAWIQDI